MKLIIDTDRDMYERLTRRDRLFTNDDVNKVCWAVYNGTPIPDNATNGDVIKAIFPNTELHKESDYVSLTIQDGVYFEDRDGSWWFAPYQKGGKDE